jgi:ATP-dependent RNA helicase DeaD
MENFNKLGLSSNTIDALRKKGYEEPTPIQEKIIPLLLSGEKDVIGQAQTGTGKTAAFGLPLIEKLSAKNRNVQAIILTPTRELAIQVAEEINSLKGKKKICVAPIYGGQSIEVQLRKLKKGVQIVVGTPGRIMDHLNRRTLKIDQLSYFILDEADEMLNMGFLEDIEEILKHTNENKKVWLFSATMPDRIIKVVKKYMGEYEFVKVSKEHVATDLTDQIYFEVNESDKFEALCRIVDVEADFYGLVFCRTKVKVEDVANRLIDRGYDAEALHGDISQHQRERILGKFKNRRINILVATDVAARGLDINNLTHVINYSLPEDPNFYVHRIGRTGRAGKEGTAITFVTPAEYRRLVYIKKVSKSSIRKEKLPEVKEIINAKIDRLKTDLSEIIEVNHHKSYMKIAEALLDKNDPVEIVSALLKYSFNGEFDERSYSKIGKVSIDRHGKTRLFVARGKSADMDEKKLVKFIMEKTKLKSLNIKDIKVFENFSFLTVPFEEAEIILRYFSKHKRGKRPLVDKAKDRQKKKA